MYIEDRVEQAVRHLEPSEAERIARVIRTLKEQSFENLQSRFQIQQLVTPGERVFVLRATDRLRILFKYREDGTLVIEDIVSHEVLDRHFGGRRR